jgi:hypothetical protein
MSLLDPKWKYVHSTATDIRKTFAKARRDLARKQRSELPSPTLRLMRSGPAGADSSVLGTSRFPLHDTRSATGDRLPNRDTAERVNVSLIKRDRSIPSW